MYARNLIPLLWIYDERINKGLYQYPDYEIQR